MVISMLIRELVIIIGMKIFVIYSMSMVVMVSACQML